MSIYKLAAGYSGGTEDAAASLDVQFDGEIVAMSLSMDPDLDADGEFAAAEVSFGSTNTVGSNDSRQSLITARTRTFILTSGSSNHGTQQNVNGTRIPVSQGERIYLHLNSTAGVGGRAVAYLYVNDSADPRLRRRR